MQVDQQGHQKLLQFLYQVPMGIIEIDQEGTVGLMNPQATQDLLSIAPGTRLTNLFDILDTYDSSVSEAVRQYESDFGSIIEKHPIEFTGQEGTTKNFWIDISKISESSYTVILRDVTSYFQKEKQYIAAKEKAALERGKSEIATGMLHDIGNAITGMGSNVSKIHANSKWEELERLGQLQAFIESERQSLSKSLGLEKSDALATFIQELKKQFSERQDEIHCRTEKSMASIAHITDILSIHRRYGNLPPSQERESYHLADIIEDAIGMQANGFEKRGIQVQKQYEQGVPPLNIDRTHIIQVVVNIIKNSLESYDELDNSSGSVFLISLQIKNNSVTASFTDQANGFEPHQAESLFENQTSTKERGTGIGLFQCRSIINSHGGEITLTSPGKGQGACCKIELPIQTQ